MIFPCQAKNMLLKKSGDLCFHLIRSVMLVPGLARMVESDVLVISMEHPYFFRALTIILFKFFGVPWSSELFAI